MNSGISNKNLSLITKTPLLVLVKPVLDETNEEIPRF